MALNTLKCNHLMPLSFKGLTQTYKHKALTMKFDLVHAKQQENLRKTAISLVIFLIRMLVLRFIDICSQNYPRNTVSVFSLLKHLKHAPFTGNLASARKIGLLMLQSRRLIIDLVICCKIMLGLTRLKREQFFSRIPVNLTRATRIQTIYVPSSSINAWKCLLSIRIIEPWIRRVSNPDICRFPFFKSF